jgi:hypothetical protein
MALMRQIESGIEESSRAWQDASLLHKKLLFPGLSPSQTDKTVNQKQRGTHMSVLLINRFMLKLLLLITFILSALLQSPSTGYSATAADVKAFLDSYVIPSGCHIQPEPYSQSTCTPPKQLSGVKIILICSSQIVSSVSTLVNVTQVSTVTAVDCCPNCLGFDYRFGSWTLVHAYVQYTNTYCDGSTFTATASTGNNYLQFYYSSPYACGYLMYDYYPRTVPNPNANCAVDKTVIATFFPLCTPGDDCCGVCGECCPVK